MKSRMRIRDKILARTKKRPLAATKDLQEINHAEEDSETTQEPVRRFEEAFAEALANALGTVAEAVESLAPVPGSTGFGSQ